MPAFENDEQATKAIAREVEYTVMHEFREFFKLDGRKVHQDLLDRQHNNLLSPPGVVATHADA